MPVVPLIGAPYVLPRAKDKSTMLDDGHFVMSNVIESTSRNSQYACGGFTTSVEISRAKPPSTKASFAVESTVSAMLVATATNMARPTMPKLAPNLPEIGDRTPIALLPVFPRQ